MPNIGCSRRGLMRPRARQTGIMLAASQKGKNRGTGLTFWKEYSAKPFYSPGPANCQSKSTMKGVRSHTSMRISWRARHSAEAVMVHLCWTIMTGQLLKHSRLMCLRDRRSAMKRCSGSRRGDGVTSADRPFLLMSGMLRPDVVCDRLTIATTDRDLRSRTTTDAWVLPLRPWAFVAASCRAVRLSAGYWHSAPGVGLSSLGSSARRQEVRLSRSARSFD